jgi:hypothetical protein
LAAKKWLIPVNPAEGLRPIKRDAIASAPATSANHSRSSKSRTSSKASIMPNVPNARATATPVDLAVDKVSADYDESGVARTRAIAVLDDKTRKKARKNTRKLIDLKFDGRLTQLITVADSGFSAIKAARAKRGAVVVPVPKQGRELIFIFVLSDDARAVCVLVVNSPAADRQRDCIRDIFLVTEITNFNGEIEYSLLEPSDWCGPVCKGDIGLTAEILKFQPRPKPGA